MPAAASRSVTATMLPCISGGKIGLTACSTARAAIGAGQEIAAVDEAAADARDRRAVPAVEVGQDVRADLGDFDCVVAAASTTSSPTA